MIYHFVMVAKPGEAPALRAALEALGQAVRPIEGCTGIELMQDTAAPERFTFLERWTSQEAHDIGARTLPKETFAPIMAAIAEPPQRVILEPLFSS